MEGISLLLKNKSLQDCWVYVGAIDVHYLLAKSEKHIRACEGENIYAVSGKQNIKHLGIIYQGLQLLEISF